MEALASLLDKYVETFFVGFLVVMPGILIANGNITASRVGDDIALFFGLGSASKNAQTIKLIFFFLAIFSSGLFFKSITYWVFEGTHEKVVAYTECKYRSIKGDPSNPKKCDHNGCQKFEISVEDYWLDQLWNNSNNSCRIENYLNHLPKQARWFVLQRESYNAQIESIGRNITISQGFMFSALVAIFASLMKLVYILRDRTVILSTAIYILCGVAFYMLSFRTWWALEERYHMRIIVSEQFLSKNNDKMEDAIVAVKH